MILALCGLGGIGRADSITFAFTTLDVPGAVSTSSYGINDVGQIVGSYKTSGDSTSHGFLYDASGFTTIDVPSRQPSLPPGDTTLSGINNAGQIVGTFSETSSHISRAFELDNNGITFIGPPGSVSTGAFGINNHDQIVGYFDNGSGFWRGFLYTEGAFTTIAIPGVSISGPVAINDLGQMLLRGDTYHGYLYSNGVFTDIALPGTRNSYVYGINDAGQIVGLSYVAGVLDPVDGFIPIRMPGIRSLTAFDINNLGQIVGEFYDSSGMHGFVATPVPEASSALLIASALLAAIWIGRRRNEFRLRINSRARRNDRML